MDIEFIGGPWDGKVRDVTKFIEYCQVDADAHPVRNMNMQGAASPKEPALFKVATYRLAQYNSGEYIYIYQR